MKKVLRNIITFILLGFYLTGFCGVHFIKHSCYSCEHSEIHFTVDANCSDNKDCHCCWNQHAHHDTKHHSPEHTDNVKLCCDYDLVYLKTDPNTTLNETCKTPLAVEISLFSANTLDTILNSFATITSCGYENSPDDHIHMDRNKLCIYLC